ncbi:MAG TPA: transporter substrate-binding domain-containing protein [Candidatus Limosilactobacillus merdipullorum]|uniref:Transporter substrate-binding domain-containing protein n=1 Tax=Candidatus Limosilactobacillus merdipullorum TaxID=2838653 RepID=A0A9D1QP96_9LACO|nr:transporter substrate-binding domain-containing protein [Candidatus Limosilactobacillus merdipullorum]
MKFKFKKSLVVALAAVITLGGLLGGCGKKDNSLKKVKDKNELVVGTSADFAPYDFQIVKNGKKQIVGYDIMLAHEIAKEAGIKHVKVVNMSFPSLITELQNKKVDVVMAGMAYTNQRAKVVSFSKVYHNDSGRGQVLLVSPKNKAKYKNIAALSGTSLGAQQGSEQEKIANKVKGAKVVTESSLASLTTELKNGTLDGVVCAEDTAQAYVKEHPNDYAIADNIGFKYDKSAAGTRVVVRKDDKQLLNSINKCITKNQKNGNLQKMYQQAVYLQIANNQ